jgi:hypothetical protein
LNVSVTGILVGGHIFVYDVCKDDLWLVKGRPEFNHFRATEKLQPEELAASSIVHEFVNPGPLIIEVFQDQTIIVVIRTTVYIWWHNICCNTRLQPENQGKCHRVLSGNWNTVEFGSSSNSSIITPLCSKYMVDEKASLYWSLLFISETEGTQQVRHIVIRKNVVQRGLKDKPENIRIVFELEEPTNLRTHVTSYSPCGRLCVIGLNFENRKSRIYLLHNVDQNAYTQPLTSELDFLSENETLKSVDFTHKGNYD